MNSEEFSNGLDEFDLPPEVKNDLLLLSQAWKLMVRTMTTVEPPVALKVNEKALVAWLNAVEEALQMMVKLGTQETGDSQRDIYGFVMGIMFGIELTELRHA